MSGGRDTVLGNVRRNLQRMRSVDDRIGELEQRMHQHPRQTVPERAQRVPAEQVELFVQMAEEASASLQRVADWAAVPAAVAEFVLRHNFPPELVVAPAAELVELPWTGQNQLRVEHRAARDGDRVSVAPAFAGIAETGTLMLLSGPGSPTSLNFLPDAHIVVLSADRIVGPYEDAWQRLRARGAMPRSVNFITGPSRSADIEQTLQLGAHGPIELHIILVAPASI